ncbi:50S ribosomal protein L25 [Solibacillus sp. R5-41]|uniref:50S ribosomal protein L25 n=1 Tax=Solibacillus sp. R5-41 TaxID=2048654 RepID=UPI0012FE4004|nr:50S ribosomal protein L25 [Solibacillus sp. R5-41]
MKLEAIERQFGARALLAEVRNNGKVPAVLYGYQTVTTPIAINAKTIFKFIAANGLNNVFTLEVNNQSYNAVISEVQRSARKGTITHVDFKSINMDTPLEVYVPVTLVGNAAGVKVGGILMQPTTTAQIKVKPNEIPDSIEVDITTLEIEQTITLADLVAKLPYEIISELDGVLATIMAPVEAEAELTTT